MAFEYMSTNKGGKGGVIVNISSAAGKMNGIFSQ